MSDPLIVERNGRWEFSNHPGFPVSSVGHGWQSAEVIVRNYTHVPISIEEARAAMAWTFPAIHDAPVVEIPDMGMDSASIRCTCGTFFSLFNVDGERFTCPFCGSAWSVTITVTVAADTTEDTMTDAISP